MTTDELAASNRDAQVLPLAKAASLAPGEQVQEKRPSLWRRLRLDILLIVVTMIWGSTFLIVQKTVRLSGPFTFLALCFGVGSLTLAIIFRKRLRHLTRSELVMGMFIGLFLFAGYALQTTGLQFTTSSKAGFITGLYVPLVPVFSWLILRQQPTRGAVVGIALSVIGLILLSINNQFNFEFGLGEALILGCAFAFALHIISISKFVPHADAVNLAIVQLTLTSVLSFIAMPLAREPFVMPPLPVWGAVVFMGVVDIAFCLVAMNWVQQFISSNRATLVYALEPAWAGLFGYLAGQNLSNPAWIGCACIFLGMIVGVVRFSAVTAFFARVTK
ncbi:MAG TPA: DMT family transporter [Ktedonobacteraceae bacterium]|nr:DMT family transporter [Ktedonobacteraceae bacterium]